MSAGDYEGSGDAFLGDTPLGRVGFVLYGFEDVRGRQANGSIHLVDTPNDGLLGRDLTITPDDETGSFKVAVIEIRNGGFMIASQGEMPWWQ